MDHRQGLISITLIVVLSLTVCGTTSGNAKSFVAPAEPRISAQNPILDFYAGGTSGVFSLRMSPRGGEMSADGADRIVWMPWGYVTTQWSIGKVYIFFLANVTQNDFRIGFLYLMNSSYNQFILRVFDYQTANINLFNFVGIQHVYNRTVFTSPTPMPQLQIAAQAKVKGGFSAFGRGMYLTADGGTEILGASTLNIYPIYNQIFSGHNDYNELWSLMVDGLGSYYFAILYMLNSDTNHIIVEHQLRLNNYLRLAGRTVDATWTVGRFPDQVTVRLPTGYANVTIDGLRFQTNGHGALTIYLPNMEVSIQAPAELTAFNSSRLRFTSWTNYGSSNPLSIIINSSLDLRANYQTEHPLTIASTYGNPQGGGWYVGQDCLGVFLGAKKTMPFLLSTWN